MTVTLLEPYAASLPLDAVAVEPGGIFVALNGDGDIPAKRASLPNRSSMVSRSFRTDEASTTKNALLDTPFSVAAKDGFQHHEIVVFAKLSQSERSVSPGIAAEQQMAMRKHILTQVDGGAIKNDDVRSSAYGLLQFQSNLYLAVDGHPIPHRTQR